MTYRRWTMSVPILLAACSAPPQAPVAGDAYVRLAAVPGRPAAAYFTLHGGATDLVLNGVAVPGVARAELHGSRMTGNGMATMDSLATVPIPAKADVAFAPGGRHVMLFGVPAAITPGATVPLTLRLSDGSALRVDARVIAAGDPAPA